MLWQRVDQEVIAVGPVEGAQIIQSGNMVGMGVRDKNRVDLRQPVRHQLVADIRAGVDENRRISGLHKHGAPLTVVPRVGRITGAPAGMAERRNTDGGSASEKRDLHVASIRENRRSVFLEVTAAILAGSCPRISARQFSVWAV